MGRSGTKILHLRNGTHTLPTIKTSEARFIDKHISTQFSTRSSDLQICHPKQPTSDKRKQDSGQRRYPVVVGLDESGGTIGRDELLKEKGNAFWLMLGSLLCLLLGLALLIR